MEMEWGRGFARFDPYKSLGAGVPSAQALGLLESLLQGFSPYVPCGYMAMLGSSHCSAWVGLDATGTGGLSEQPVWSVRLSLAYCPCMMALTLLAQCPKVGSKALASLLLKTRVWKTFIFQVQSKPET